MDATSSGKTDLAEAQQLLAQLLTAGYTPAARAPTCALVFASHLRYVRIMLDTVTHHAVRWQHVNRSNVETVCRSLASDGRTDWLGLTFHVLVRVCSSVRQPEIN